MEQKFASVYLARSQFSKNVYKTNLKVIKDTELWFQDSYNGIAQQICDPLFRSVSNATIISVKTKPEATSSLIEFLVEGNCRSNDDCSGFQLLFEDILDDFSRKLRLGTMENQEEQNMFALSGGRSRLLQKSKESDQKDQCLCHNVNAKQPVLLEEELLTVFQQGLGIVLQDAKLESCKSCRFDVDCKFGQCLSGRCSKEDGKLKLGCECSLDGDCQSGFCDKCTPSPDDALSSSAVCRNATTADVVFCPTSASPTSERSSNPSSSPTIIPTSGPTFSPTGIPSTTLTSSPTALPTDLPSSVPSQLSSTSPPTGTPSVSPTSSPAGKPSTSPSTDPTSSSTGKPSTSPSTSPSDFLTPLPSDHPTPLPSDYPTPLPTEVPFCGDGVVDVDNGEQCDDGNNDEGDGCSFACIREPCLDIQAGTLDLIAVETYCAGTTNTSDNEKCCFVEGSIGIGGACSNWDTGGTYRICQGSCLGTDSCKDLGGTTTIGPNSCTETDSCLGVGGAGITTIGAWACQGERACQDTGGVKAQTVGKNGLSRRQISPYMWPRSSTSTSFFGARDGHFKINPLKTARSNRRNRAVIDTL